jgi:peroxin-2
LGGNSGGIIGSAQTDITNPYETIPCGCLYCYVCIAEKLESEEGEGWICLRCGEIVNKCKPWDGDVLEETRPQSKGRNVGFVTADDTRSETSTAESVDMDADHIQESNQWASIGREEAEEESDDIEPENTE